MAEFYKEYESPKINRVKKSIKLDSDIDQDFVRGTSASTCNFHGY